eukprot:CAMPEP_0185737788 /NCGR_PEP_ID=MMETSP1171-20130828/31287_1 /TAXON_ID=374046 /ORGANISM="Helicotheca tamensis, Strain CCMP826" /LENGTH=37 /DNA_ID= /DNA_START= /DNA_END= /DNA_ORIENTATION=
MSEISLRLSMACIFAGKFAGQQGGVRGANGSSSTSPE